MAKEVVDSFIAFYKNEYDVITSKELASMFSNDGFDPYDEHLFKDQKGAHMTLKAASEFPEYVIDIDDLAEVMSEEFVDALFACDFDFLRENTVPMRSMVEAIAKAETEIANLDKGG